MNANQKRLEFFECYKNFKAWHNNVLYLMFESNSKIEAEAYICDEVKEMVRSTRELKRFYKGRKLQQAIIWAELTF